MEERTVTAIVGSVDPVDAEPGTYVIGFADGESVDPDEQEYTWLTVRPDDGDFLPAVGEIVLVSIPRIVAILGRADF